MTDPTTTNGHEPPLPDMTRRTALQVMGTTAAAATVSGVPVNLPKVAAAAGVLSSVVREAPLLSRTLQATVSELVGKQLEQTFYDFHNTLLPYVAHPAPGQANGPAGLEELTHYMQAYAPVAANIDTIISTIRKTDGILPQLDFLERLYEDDLRARLREQREIVREKSTHQPRIRSPELDARLTAMADEKLSTRSLAELEKIEDDLNWRNYAKDQHDREAMERREHNNTEQTRAPLERAQNRIFGTRIDLHMHMDFMDTHTLRERMPQLAEVPEHFGNILSFLKGKGSIKEIIVDYFARCGEVLAPSLPAGEVKERMEKAFDTEVERHAQLKERREKIEKRHEELKPLNEALGNQDIAYWSSLGRGPMAHKVILSSGNKEALEKVEEQIKVFFPDDRRTSRLRLNPGQMVFEDPTRELADILEHHVKSSKDTERAR